MAETVKAMVAPLFKTLHSHDMGANPPHVILRFEAANGKLFEVKIAAAAVPITMAAVSAQMSRLPAQTEPEGQPLSLASWQKFVSDDGRGGLTLNLGAGISLLLLIQPESLPRLRGDILELEEMLKAPKAGAAKH